MKFMLFISDISNFFSLEEIFKVKKVSTNFILAKKQEKIFEPDYPC